MPRRKALVPTFDGNAAFAEDPEAAALNDPRVEQLDDPPTVGGRPAPTDMFGQPAQSVLGRATSPKLYAQAAMFPTCHQLRVWKWENGVPVGLGVIDAHATEEEMCRQFFAAMPRPGEGKATFKLRPVDINGEEMGQEITLILGEHHGALQSLRAAQAGANGSGPGMYPGGLGADTAKLFEKMIDLTEKRATLLESALEKERERVRSEDEERARERVDLATNAAAGVQALTERMMQDESRRSDSALKVQQELTERAVKLQATQGETMVTTLTQIFEQQRMTMQAGMDEARRQDNLRLEQERIRAEREREEADRRRTREVEDLQRRLDAEKVEAERRIREREKELELRLQREKDELDRKERQAKEEAERREKHEHDEYERRISRDGEIMREREQDRQRQHERMLKEMEISSTQQREHAERMMQLTKAEMSASAPGGMLELLPKAAALMKSLGMEPGDVLGRVFGSDDGAGAATWADIISRVVGAAGDVAKEAIKAKAGRETMPQLVAQPVWGLPGSGPIGMLPGAMGQGVPVGAAVEAGTLDAGAGGDAGATPAAAPPAAPPDADPEIALPLAVQKAARVAIRALVQKLKHSAKEKWQEIVATAISQEPGIYHFVQATSLRAALKAAGADDALAAEVVEAVQSNPLVPSDLNLG